jgi:hypothetical protein
MPASAVLASATLGSWENLENWWRGSNPAGSRQITISLEPYDLPMSTLNVYSEDKLQPVSPLGQGVIESKHSTDVESPSRPTWGVDENKHSTDVESLSLLLLLLLGGFGITNTRPTLNLVLLVLLLLLLVFASV